MGVEVTRWVRTCARCQALKIHRHIKAPLSTFPPVQRRFEHIHVDVIGPLLSSLGSTHLLTVVDRFSHWPEAFPVVETSTLTLALALLHGWIARFGTPSVITSDRGSQFVSELWRHFATLLGIELHSTTAYHPQANRLVERFSQRLEGVTARPTRRRRRQLEGPAAVGAPQSEDSRQRGPQYVIGRTRLRRASNRPRRLCRPADRRRPVASSRTPPRRRSAPPSYPNISTRSTAGTRSGQPQNGQLCLRPSRQPQGASSTTLQWPTPGPQTWRQDVSNRRRWSRKH